MPDEKKQERELLRRRSVAPPPKERFEILVEELRSEFKAVAEGQTALAGRMDRHEHRMDEHERKQDAQFADVKNFVMTMGRDLNGKIDGVNTSLTEKIDGVEKRLDAKIDGFNASLIAKIDGVEKRLDAKIDGFNASLIAKIDGAETKLTARIDGVREELTEHMCALTKNLADHRADTEEHGRAYRVSER